MATSPAAVAPEAPPSRRERRRLEVYERILEAGESLFLEQGYEDTKVADICEGADVAWGTFFNHFPTKRDLLVALADRAVDGTKEQLDALTKKPGSIEDLLVELFAQGAQELQGVSAGRRALAAQVQSMAFTEAPEDRDRSYHAAFESFLAKGVEEGRVRGDVPVATLADALASAYASMSLSWVHIEDFPVRARAAGLARLLARTLAPAA